MIAPNRTAYKRQSSAQNSPVLLSSRSTSLRAARGTSSVPLWCRQISQSSTSTGGSSRSSQTTPSRTLTQCSAARKPQPYTAAYSPVSPRCFGASQSASAQPGKIK